MKFRVEGDVIASEYWTTQIEASSEGEALEIFRREAQRGFMPMEFSIQVVDVSRVEE